jgi:HK97 family phage prohead protease
MDEPNKSQDETKEVQNPNLTNPSDAKTFSADIKNYDEVKAEDVDDDRTVMAVISSDRIDRDGEILLPKGAVIEEFVKNPVILWNHDAYQPPIGKAMWIRRKGNQLVAKIKFAATEMADTVYQLFKGGFLNAFSIRFRPLEGRAPTADDVKSNPTWKNARFIFSKWELLEASPVTIPANPDALAIAVKSKHFTNNEHVARMFQIITEEEEILFQVKEDEVPEVKSIEEYTEDVIEEFLEDCHVIRDPCRQFRDAVEAVTCIRR